MVEKNLEHLYAIGCYITYKIYISATIQQSEMDSPTCSVNSGVTHMLFYAFVKLFGINSTLHTYISSCPVAASKSKTKFLYGPMAVLFRPLAR